MADYRHVINSDGSSYILNPDRSHNITFESDELEQAKDKFKELKSTPTPSPTSDSLNLLGAGKSYGES